MLSDSLEKHPALGYIGAATPAAAGFWVFVESATKVGALLSVVVGIAVGVITFLVQLRHKRRLDAEEKSRGA